MGEKDIAEASFIELNDVFADIFNVLIYKGKRVIKENELQQMPRKANIKVMMTGFMSKNVMY